MEKFQIQENLLISTSLLINKINSQNKMEVDCDTFAHQRLERMNSSNLAFKELIQSLRIKNKHFQRKTLSEINPQSDKSNASQVCFSEVNNNNLSIVKPRKQEINASEKNIVQLNHPPPLISVTKNQDDVIKLKPKGNVAGRDVLNHKPNTIPAETFTETAISLRSSLKNRNNQQKQQRVAEQTKKEEKSIEQALLSKRSSNAQTLANINKVLSNLAEKELQQDINEKESPQKQIEQRAQVPNPLKLTKKNSFNQNKLNSKTITNNKKVKDIDQQLIIKYCNNQTGLTKFSQAAEVFEFFQGLLDMCKIHIQCPLIKKFKNCIYFGHQINENEKYEGFLYFYTRKVYYGEFFNGQKNGHGVQILFDEEIVYKGSFVNGQKSGKFYVRNNQTREQYIGFLEKGAYHGKGKLITKEYVYEGDFMNGEKHGFGEQYHHKTGVKFTGYFNRGQFQKRSKSSFDRNDLERGINFKTNHSKPKYSNAVTPRLSQTNRSHVEFPSTNKNKMLDYINYSNTNELQMSPFSSTQGFTGYQKNSSRGGGGNRMIFNKDKIRSFMPQVRSHFHEPLPENFQDFDYSFDASSRQTSQSSMNPFNFNSGNPLSVRRKGNNIGWGHQGNSFPMVSNFPEIEQQKLNTSQCEDPLPMPAFLPKK